MGGTALPVQKNVTVDANGACTTTRNSYALSAINATLITITTSGCCRYGQYSGEDLCPLTCYDPIYNTV